MLPVPKPDQDLLELVEMPPAKLRERSAANVAKLRELFPLERVAPLTGNQKLFNKIQQINAAADDNLPTSSGGGGDTAGTNQQRSSEEHGSSHVLLEVGSVTPAEDFAELLHRGEKFSVLCQQIQNVIGDLILKSIECPVTKVSMALLVYREEAKIIGAFRYNEWIVGFKTMLFDRRKSSVWDEIFVREQYGLITASESETSTVTPEEAKQFYEMPAADPNGGRIDGDDEDIDDILGDM